MYSLWKIFMKEKPYTAPGSRKKKNSWQPMIISKAIFKLGTDGVLHPIWRCIHLRIQECLASPWGWIRCGLYLWKDEERVRNEKELIIGKDNILFRENRQAWKGSNNFKYLRALSLKRSLAHAVKPETQGKGRNEKENNLKEPTSVEVSLTMGVS